MKKYSKLTILTIIFVVIYSSFVCRFVVAADDVSDVVVNLQINNPIMEVNGIKGEIDEGQGTKPIVRDGRTLVPIRAIIESFGGVVDWDGSTRSVIITMKDDTIRLFIDSTTAYLNNKKETLDVAPAIINERTMLPIRFIAEGFNLGVAWNGNTQTVSIIRNSFDMQEYNYLMSMVPEYSGIPYAQINNNVPLFKDYEIVEGSFEYYGDLDELGRCDVCMASIASDIMPTEKRGDIGSITPTGWQNASYNNIDGKYLYNRCHLIGYQLTGENANEKNLITGTRYLNVEGMLPFENMVDNYIEQTGNRVMYRATPVFKANNLVADGVLLEAYSVEDNGQGVSFCVYCYNIQPSIIIDYTTGANSSENTAETDNTENKGTAKQNNTTTNNEKLYSLVYRTPSGKKYHFDPECGGKNSFEVTFDQAISAGLTPCSKCSK